MSVAFDAHGDIVPSRGTTSSMSLSRCSSSHAGPYVSSACKVAVCAADNGCFSLAKCQYCVRIPVTAGNVLRTWDRSLSRRKSDSARRPGSFRVSDIGNGDGAANANYTGSGEIAPQPTQHLNAEARRTQRTRRETVQSNLGACRTACVRPSHVHVTIAWTIASRSVFALLFSAVSASFAPLR